MSEVCFCEIKSPAASSLALLILRPVDNLSNEVPNVPCELLKLLCANNECTFVLIDNMADPLSIFLICFCCLS